MKKILRIWMLPISMTTGVAAYFVYASIPWLDCTHALASRMALIIQPVLIFMMLFITFCKINPRDLHFEKWHGWLIALQAVELIVLALLLWLNPDMAARSIVEGAML